LRAVDSEVRMDFGTMIRRIRTDLNRGSNHDQRIKEAICDAIKRYRSTRFGFNQKKSWTVLTSQYEVLSLPDYWLEVDHLRLEVDADREPLREVSYDWIEDRQRGTPFHSKPTHYAIHNRELRFYPIPDSSYTLVMSFHCDLPEVSVSAADTATNSWMVEGEELIRKRAMGDMLVTYIGGSMIPVGRDLLDEVSRDILPSLEMRAAREQTTGQIRAFL
jgi:hypothetical protein